MSEEGSSRVYFLGAGASAAEARPEKRVLTQDFLRRAFEMVEDEVVFIGYSMPEADFHIKYLLQEALYRDPRPQDTVVDYKAPDVERPTLEEIRFTRLFGPEITYHMRGLARYVDERME